LSHHLCNLLKDLSVRRLVFASSYLIYDPSLYLHAGPQQAARALVESDPVRPRNLCGAAKFYHEQELQFLVRTNQACSITTARIFRGYGRGSRDVISRWIRELLRDRPIDVFRTEGLFDFIYADDSAEALIRLAMLDGGEVVNVGSGSARRVTEVLQILRRHFPRMLVREIESDIPHEASQADIALLHRLTSWRPAFTLETAIPQIVDHAREELESGEDHSSPVNGGPRSPRRRGMGGILVTSVSRKVPMLEAVRAAARKVGRPFRILGADIKADCIAAHFVDHFWRMPSIGDLTDTELIDYCRSNEVGFIIPSRDGELGFFAAARAALANAGIAVMISSEDAVQYCHDKLAFSERLHSRGFPAIGAFLRLDDVLSQRIVVKERFGAGASGLQIDVDRESARRFGSTLRHSIYQSFVEGTEFSVDVYVDRSGQCKGAIARRRELIVGGESQVTSTERHPEAESLCGAIAQMLGIYGHAVFQLIQSSTGGLHVIECNARFGGASTLSIAAGLDSFYWFLLEACGDSLSQYPFARCRRELRQIRFARDLVIDHE
jgi:carbamoyl-phosphate synthase large subunit